MTEKITVDEIYHYLTGDYYGEFDVLFFKNHGFHITFYHSNKELSKKLNDKLKNPVLRCSLYGDIDFLVSCSIENNLLKVEVDLDRNKKTSIGKDALQKIDLNRKTISLPLHGTIKQICKMLDGELFEILFQFHKDFNL